VTAFCVSPAAAVMALVVGAAAPDVQVVSLEYEGVLRLYSRGEREAALAALGTMRASDLDQQIHSLQRQAKRSARALDALPLRAAVMLHVDRDELERPVATGRERARPCPGEDTRRAGQIAALLAQRDLTRDFARRFFLAMAQRCQWDFCLEAAEQWGRDGLERFPGDASLQLVVGAALEEQATLGRGVGASDRIISFREAARFLADAVTADPSRLDARVRLGRVQWRLGENEAARATLEEATRRGGALPLLYLAHLFLGQVHERSGGPGEAAREFARALEIDPQSQAAAIALSHACLLAGDTKQARQVLTDALALAGQRELRDAYWDYLGSSAADAEALFEALRSETGQ
jgi:tetratricopeptide (TPR) repeat protein